jgi:CAP12/Pycsar effector protein, TIR domain
VATEIELLDTLLQELDRLAFGDDTARDALIKRTQMYLRRIVGDESEYVRDVGRIRFHPMYAPADESAKRSSWIFASGRLRNLLNTVREEFELFGSGNRGGTQATSGNATSVFIVHGHDEELKQSIARYVEKLGLDAIILHEKPNKGRTIIEKFDDYASVGFAIVLLSADDVVRVTGEEHADSYRARQNVIFELGFFLGRLGREKVAAIFRPHENFEMPSDYSGVLFVPYEADGSWRFKLAKELKECGFKLNLEAIL